MDNHEPTDTTAMERFVRGIVAGMCFIRPGYIEKFDPKTQLAEVTPAIMMKKSVDGKVEYKKLPKLVNVPIIVPYVQTLGLALTLPIKPGDECTLIFADRFMDDCYEKGTQEGNAKPEACGGDNKTSEPRMHHMTDAICIPGLITKPKVLPEWSVEAIEIRNFKRTMFISLKPDGDITMQTIGNITMRAAGDIAIHAGGDVIETGSNINLN